MLYLNNYGIAQNCEYFSLRISTCASVGGGDVLGNNGLHGYNYVPVKFMGKSTLGKKV